MSFCPFCSQCPQCCSQTGCRGKVAKILASLAKHGCKSSGSLYPQGGLHSSLQAETPFGQIPLGSKWLCQSYKESVVKRGSLKSQKKVGSGKGGCQVVPGFLQPSFSGSETKQEMEANLGSESVKCIPQHRHFQNGNPGDDPVVLENRGVGHIAGLQRRILPHSNCPKVKKVSQVLLVQSNLSVHSSSLRVGHSSPGVYQGGQRSETHGSSEGHQDPLVPRRLVTTSPFPGNLPTTYPDPFGPMSAVRLGSKYDQVRVSSQTGLQFCGLPVRLNHRSGSTHSRPVGNPSREVEVHKRTSPVYGSSIHVLDRPPDGHRETSVCGSSSYEAHSVASEEKLACPGSPRKSDSSPSVTPPSFGLVVGGSKCTERSTPAPSSARRYCLPTSQRKVGAHT